MLDTIKSALDTALGLDLEARDINAWQMSLRALVAFGMATALIRIGNKRFMGQSTAMDVMLGIVYGSIVSRAITGNAAFFPAMAASLTLVAFHWLLAAIAFRSPRLGKMWTGDDQLLVKDGQIHWSAMKKSHITEKDLREAQRRHGKEPDVSKIASAHLERNGEISIISK
jgi:uncharacterized membrane protein YcaP (DUF421 family)